MSLCLINMNPKLLLLRKNIWMVATLCIGVSSFSHAEVYKCENAGKISYQQSPCETKSKSTKMAMSSASPNLWTNLKSGLSVAEVQRMVPQAKKGDYSSLSNGARGLLQVSSVNVAGKKFAANFFFLGDRFHRVNFSGAMNDSNESNLKAFNQIFEGFQSRYGVAANRRIANEYGLSARAEWKLPTGEVWIVVVPITATTSLLNFGYFPNSN